MTESFRKRNRFGRTTVLTLNVLYTCSISTFLFSFFCFYYLNIKGVIFKALLIYSIVNAINILFFYKHKKILNSYLIGSFLAYITILVVSFYSGAINSPAISFSVLLIFFGYLISKFYGNLWLVLVSISTLFFYLVTKSKYEIINEINKENNADFNLVFLLFLIILLGGVFGRLMNKTNEKIKKTKLEIVKRNDEKTVMLKEIHHRVKNNLQVVNSLLRIQARGVEDEKVKIMFKMAQLRVVAMARLHEKIYNTDNLKTIDVTEHIKQLINDLIMGYNIDTKINTVLNIEPVKLSIDTLLPLSLIINEMISNSLKHAFNGREKGEIILGLRMIEYNTYELLVKDDGIGSKNNIFSDLVNSTGSRLIRAFIKQLNGTIEVLEGNTGTGCKIFFSNIDNK